MGILLFLTWALDGVNGQLHVPAALTRWNLQSFGVNTLPGIELWSHGLRALTWSRHGIQQTFCNYLIHIRWGIKRYSAHHIFIIIVIKRWGLGPLRSVSLDIAYAPGLSTFFGLPISPLPLQSHSEANSGRWSSSILTTCCTTHNQGLKSGKTSVHPNIFWDARQVWFSPWICSSKWRRFIMNWRCWFRDNTKLRNEFSALFLQLTQTVWCITGLFESCYDFSVTTPKAHNGNCGCLVC
jgi:hypothetical protein